MRDKLPVILRPLWVESEALHGCDDLLCKRFVGVEFVPRLFCVLLRSFPRVYRPEAFKKTVCPRRSLAPRFFPCGGYKGSILTFPYLF